MKTREIKQRMVAFCRLWPSFDAMSVSLARGGSRPGSGTHADYEIDELRAVAVERLFKASGLQVTQPFNRADLRLSCERARWAADGARTVVLTIGRAAVMLAVPGDLWGELGLAELAVAS